MRLVTDKTLARIADEIVERTSKAAERDLDEIAESIAIPLTQYMQKMGYEISSSGMAPAGLMASATEVRESRVNQTRSAYFDKSLGFSPIRLTTEFALGDGGIPCPTVIENPFAAKSKSEAIAQPGIERQQEWLQRFWEDDLNKRVLTGSVAQYAISDKLQYDGELFVALFGGSDPLIRQPVGDIMAARFFDTLEVKDPVVTAPGDNALELGYWKKHIDQTFMLTAPGIATKSPGYDLYPSTLLPQRYKLADPKLKQFMGEVAKNCQPGAWVYHQTYGSDLLETRGWPATARIVGWIEKHDTVFKDAMQLLRALLQFAWTRKVKPGTPAQVEQQRRGALVKSIYQHLANKAVAGSTIVEGEGIENKPVDTPTGGISIADTLAKKIEIMVSAGTGWPHNYLTGDISQGTLATARSMELPVVKGARLWQSQLRSFFEGVSEFVLWAQFKATAGKCHADFPPIVEDDIPATITALNGCATLGTLPIEDDADGQPGITTLIRTVMGRRV